MCEIPELLICDGGLYEKGVFFESLDMSGFRGEVALWTIPFSMNVLNRIEGTFGADNSVDNVCLCYLKFLEYIYI